MGRARQREREIGGYKKIAPLRGGGGEMRPELNCFGGLSANQRRRSKLLSSGIVAKSPPYRHASKSMPAAVAVTRPSMGA